MCASVCVRLRGFTAKTKFTQLVNTSQHSELALNHTHYESLHRLNCKILIHA